MASFQTWLRGHRVTASVTVIALIAGVPITFAALHQGFPVTDVQLNSRDVWVTNASTGQAGRLNRQVNQLNGQVVADSASFDVLENGSDTDTVFIEDKTGNTLKYIDPDVTTTSKAAITLPAGATVSYGDQTIAVLSTDGKLWTMVASANTSFAYKSQPPVLKSLGPGARAVVGDDGTTWVVSPTQHKLFSVGADGKIGGAVGLPALDSFQVSVVGTHAVILDVKNHRLIKDDGSSLTVPSSTVQLQVPSADSDYALVATSTSLVRVPLSGSSVTTVPADLSSNGGLIAPPVQLGGCDSGAWSAGRYLYACGSKITPYTIHGAVATHELRFRVNGPVIALNDVADGMAWLSGSKSLVPVDNWKDVTPPKDDTTDQEQNKTTVQTFTEAPLPEWGENHPPVAVDDAFGVRSSDPVSGGTGVTTTLPVLDNDSDPDGDVLTVGDIGTIPSSFGTAEKVDGGRAIQFQSAQGATGSYSFSYSATDGRPGGVADATVTVTIHAYDDPGSAPVARRASALVVEAGQSASYNVLSDWIDPDGDALRLESATVASGDTVRYTPDGLVTFQSTTAQTGIQQVTFTVIDSSSAKLQATGTLSVDVQPPGGKPVPIQDYASGFVNDSIVVSPLINDRSPSGQPLILLSVTALNGGAPPVANLVAGTVTIAEPTVGTYYFNYALGAGTGTATGRIRVDVTRKPSGHQPPIAVSDTAYLIGTDPVTIPVLDNDVSPSGDVLGVQTVDLRTSNPQFKVEILNSTELRVTAPAPLDSQVTIGYTISDGTSSSSADVTIVPVPVLQKHQAPLAVDDNMTVRAGDVASVSVLSNDVDPDGAKLGVAAELAQLPSAGFAFVSGDLVRFKAPDKAGVYTVVYTAVDSANESATAKVNFTVIAADAKNHPPQPQPIIARVFTGGTVHITVPVDGIDPDGDSVSLSDPGVPSYGTISPNFGTASFDYKAGTIAGTDTFDYVVVDSHGMTGIAKVQVGVIPRLPPLPPVAINDDLEMRPSSDSTVDVTQNDSDPNGNAISVSSKLQIQPATGISAKVVANQVIVTSGAPEGKYSITYTIADASKPSLTATATLSVVVSKNAPARPPTAIDHVLTKKQVADGKDVPVKALTGAHDPSGLVSALMVSLQPGQTNAAIGADGTTITVTPTKQPQAIPYTLTSKSGLSSSAFMVVPAIPDKGWDQLPYIKKGLSSSVTTVERNTNKQWALADIVTAPSGTAVKLDPTDSVSATHSNGSKLFVNASTIQFTPAAGFAGPALITFRVSDAQGHAATLVFHITVGAKDGSDIPPTFTAVKVNVPADSTVPVNLHDGTTASSPQQLASISYTSDAGTGGGGKVHGTVSGSTLNVTVDSGTKPGTTVTYDVELAVGKFSHIQGKVIATVVSTLKPLPQTVTDTLHVKRGSSAVAVHPLDNDVNPYPASQPLKLVGDPTIETAGTSATAARGGDDTILITPGPSYIGDLSVTYQVQDASDDPTRIVTGRIVVTVWDVPDQQAAPTIVSSSDSQVTVRFQPPPSINGSPVDHYTVRSSPASSSPSCSAGADCIFTGLTNGQAYTFYVSATNEVGASQESPASATATPYRIPSNPSSASLSSSGYPATLNLSWGAPADQGGGNVSYQWMMWKDGNEIQGSYAAGQTANMTGQTAGTYYYQVEACNPAGCSGDPGGTYTPSGYTQSNTIVVTAPAPTLTVSKGSTHQTATGCTSSYCYPIVVAGANFPAGTSVFVSYQDNCNSDCSADGAGGQFANETVTVGSDGSIHLSDHLFGYPDRKVWVVISGVTSNSVTW